MRRREALEYEFNHLAKSLTGQCSSVNSDLPVFAFFHVILREKCSILYFVSSKHLVSRMRISYK